MNLKYMNRTDLIAIACFIIITMYFYQRLRSVFGRAYIPAILTGLCASIACVILNYLGDLARLWVWNVGFPKVSPVIGSTPIFVPIAFLITFLFSPYIQGGQRITRRIAISNNPIASGLRCSIILVVTIFMLFRAFTLGS